MSEALERLEGKIKQLLALIDRLETENRSLRSMAQSGDQSQSQAELIGRIEKHRLEKAKLEQKLVLVERSLDRVISEIDKTEL